MATLKKFILRILSYSQNFFLKSHNSKENCFKKHILRILVNMCLGLIIHYHTVSKHSTKGLIKFTTVCPKKLLFSMCTKEVKLTEKAYNGILYTVKELTL